MKKTLHRLPELQFMPESDRSCLKVYIRVYIHIIEAPKPIEHHGTAVPLRSLGG